jgi:xylulokinase
VSYLLGLDVGTTGVRCLAIDEKGAVRAAAGVDHASYSPRPGWSEQLPEDWWRGSRAAIAQVTSAVGRDIVGIGLTGQMRYLNSS